MSHNTQTMKRKPWSDDDRARYLPQMDPKSRRSAARLFENNVQGDPEAVKPFVVINVTPLTSRENAVEQQAETDNSTTNPMTRYIQLDSDDEESEVDVENSESGEASARQENISHEDIDYPEDNSEDSMEQQAVDGHRQQHETMTMQSDNVDVIRDQGRNSMNETIEETPGEAAGRRSSEIQKSYQSPLVEKVFEKQLMRFLKELGEGIPDDYIHEGRRVWTDVALRYRIHPDRRHRFSMEKSRFLANLEDEDSRPPRWVKDDQAKLDLYYAVKKSLKEMIQKRSNRQRNIDDSEPEDLEMGDEEEEEAISIDNSEMAEDGKSSSDETMGQPETPQEKNNQVPERYSTRQRKPIHPFSPQTENLFEKELLRFLQELDQEGIPEKYICDGRKVWSDLANRYGIRPDIKRKFADYKCRFLGNLEDESSRPPGWVQSDQTILNLYYSVKGKFKAILEKRDVQQNEVNGNETGPEDLEVEEEEEPESEEEDEEVKLPNAIKKSANFAKIRLPPRNRNKPKYYGRESPDREEQQSSSAGSAKKESFKRKASSFDAHDTFSGGEESLSSSSKAEQAPSSSKRQKIAIHQTRDPLSGFFQHHREQPDRSENRMSSNSSLTGSSTIDVFEADELDDASQVYQQEQDKKPNLARLQNSLQNGIDIGVNTDHNLLEELEEARRESRREIKELKKQLAMANKMIYEERTKRERMTKLYRRGNDERLHEEFPEMRRI